MRGIVDAFHETSVRFNPRFVNGYAKLDLARGINYVNSLMVCAQQSFPSKLLYEGLEICTPEKAFEVLTTQKRNDKRYIYDFARNDFYLIQLNFSFDGATFPIYMYMPHPEEVIYIRDKPFYIKPVMADPLISVSADGLFIPLNQTRMTTRARSFFIYKDSKLLQVKIHETTIHHTLKSIQEKDNKEARQRITTNAHYLFTKEGYKEAFQRFKAVVQAGYSDTINSNNYPEEDWVIYSSAWADTKEPQITDYGEVNVEHNVLLAVKKSTINPDVESVVGAFFYILDLLPNIDDIDYLDDPAWWVVKMGKIILGNDTDDRILVSKMGSHFKTIDTYIDAMAINLMRDNDIFITDIYGYLEWQICNFDQYRYRPEADQATMYGKYLMVNTYVFKPVREAIFNAIYEMRQKSDSTKLTQREVENKLSRWLKIDICTHMNSNCPNVSAVMSSTDSRLLKIGLEIVPQDNMRTTKIKRTPKMLRNPKWKFDRSFIDAGSFSAMSKHEPIGKDGVNPCINIGLDGKIQPQAEFEEILSSVTKHTKTS